MSGRLLRKVLKEQEQSQKQEGDEITEELPESLVDESDSGGHTGNPFDLLNDDEDEDDQEDESGTADGPLAEKVNISEPITKGSAPAVPISKKSKKKKKKKNKEAMSSSADGSKKSVQVELDALSLEIESSSHGAKSNKKMGNKDMKVYDAVVREFRPSILKVDPKFLNAENELRRIFGSKVVSSFENANQGGSSRQVRGGRRGGYGHRKCVLVSSSDHWPRWDGSLSMELLETKDGNHFFRYVQSASYSQAHRGFEAAKAIHDLNGVASILMHHPYHVESLMTLADYFKFSGEHQMAADAVGKCLYALECAWHPMFSPLQGNCRLDYSNDTNKPLFLTLFNHMKNLDRRGCHRSALEVCKFLLSLDPADPMGAMFCIDYFSLRAEEYAWLELFAEEYQSDNSLWNFPNFAYSLAICRYYLEREAGLGDCKIGDEKETSAGLMKQALMLHPPVLKRLVEKVPLKDQAWAGITKSSFFKSEDTGLPSLDHLIRIYVERNYLIWRLPDVQKLLKDAAVGVLETVKHDTTEANTWACVRKEAFPSDKNEYAHLLVSDFSDTVATMPPENLQNFMMIDPRMMMEHQNPGAHEHVRAPPRDLTNRSPLAVLFESLLPWVDYGAGEAPNDEQPDGQH